MDKLTDWQIKEMAEHIFNTPCTTNLKDVKVTDENIVGKTLHEIISEIKTR